MANFINAEQVIVKTDNGVEVRLISDEVVVYKQLTKDEINMMIVALTKELNNMETSEA